LNKLPELSFGVVSGGEKLPLVRQVTLVGGRFRLFEIRLVRLDRGVLDRNGSLQVLLIGYGVLEIAARLGNLRLKDLRVELLAVGPEDFLNQSARPDQSAPDRIER